MTLPALNTINCKEVKINIDSFSPTVPEVLSALVSMPILEFHEILGDAHNYPPVELIKWDGDHPHIQNIGVSDLIMLQAHGKAYGAILYEFAHEYCHHLIGVHPGMHKGGCLWFEETLCELGSKYCLANFPALLRHIQDAQTRHIVNLCYRALSDSNNWIPHDRESLPETAFSLPLLERSSFFRIHKDGHKRGFYSYVASLCLPIFQENPRLWRILGHIGDSTRYDSLESLFVHLDCTADDSYFDSLLMLKGLLINNH